MNSEWEKRNRELGEIRSKWVGPLFGKVIRTTEKGVLFEKDQEVKYEVLLPRQWLPKRAIKVGDGLNFRDPVPGDKGCYFYIAKWFIKNQELKVAAGISPEAKVPTKAEVIENFGGRKRMLRPEVAPTEQKRINERKFEQAKQERFFGNVDKVLEKVLEPEKKVQMWSNHESGDVLAFVCEASDSPRMCPRCKKSYGFPAKDVIMTERDQEGEIQAWHYKHSCGASLIVLND